MKNLFLALLLSLSLCSCATVVGPDGQQRQVMSPVGAGIVQTLVSAGVGAGSGALMRNSPGWATGAVAGGGGSVVSQVVNSFVPQGGGYRPSSYALGAVAPGSAYRPYGASGSTPLYYRRPDGSFVRANPSYQ